VINDLPAIREKGFNVLTKELGPSGMAVFIRQLENGSGNYTEERQQLHQDVSIDDIVASIKSNRRGLPTEK